MKFSLATNWDNELIDCYSALNKKHKNKIVQIFGSAHRSIFGSANAGVPNITFKQIENRIKYAKASGLEFNYLVNSSISPRLISSEDIRVAKEYFAWIEKQNVDSLTIANENTLDFVSKNFPKININISIVMAIKTIERVNQLRREYPNIKKIILHQTLNRDRAGLIAHIKNAHNKNSKLAPVKIELLANEICLYNCPRMKVHYDALSLIAQGKNNINFNWALCGKIREKNSLEFLNSCWIRPEDVRLYEELGVDSLKISGRKESTTNLKARVKAFIEEKYDGNVMDLFLSEFWPNNRSPFVDNRSLDGFIEYIWSKGMKRIEKEDAKYKITYKWN